MMSSVPLHGSPLSRPGALSRLTSTRSLPTSTRQSVKLGALESMESSTGRMEFENVSNTKPDNARMGSGSLVHEKDSDETLKISMS